MTEPKRWTPKVSGLLYSGLVFLSLLSSVLLQTLPPVNSLAVSHPSDLTGSIQQTWRNTVQQTATKNAAVKPIASATINYPNTVGQVPYPQPVPYTNPGVQQPYPQTAPFASPVQYPGSMHYPGTVQYPGTIPSHPVGRGYASGWTGYDDDDYRQTVDGQYWTGAQYQQYPQFPQVARQPTYAGYQSGGISPPHYSAGYSNMYPTQYSQYGSSYAQYPGQQIGGFNPAYSRFNAQYWTGGVPVHMPVYRHPVPGYHRGYPPMYKKKMSHTKKLLGAALVGALAGKVIQKVG